MSTLLAASRLALADGPLGAVVLIAVGNPAAQSPEINMTTTIAITPAMAERVRISHSSREFQHLATRGVHRKSRALHYRLIRRPLAQCVGHDTGEVLAE